MGTDRVTVSPVPPEPFDGSYPKWSVEELLLRKLLWIRHGCDGLYGDDGEMQCAKCMIDFLRQSPREIERRFFELGLAKVAAGARGDAERAPAPSDGPQSMCAGLPTFWLIEQSNPTRWWAGGSDWTSEARKAICFPNWRAAQRRIENIVEIPKSAFVTEHQWMDWPESAAESEAGASARAALPSEAIPAPRVGADQNNTDGARVAVADQAGDGGAVSRADRTAADDLAIARRLNVFLDTAIDAFRHCEPDQYADTVQRAQDELVGWLVGRGARSVGESPWR